MRGGWLLFRSIRVVDFIKVVIVLKFVFSGFFL